MSTGDTIPSKSEWSVRSVPVWADYVASHVIDGNTDSSDPGFGVWAAQGGTDGMVNEDDKEPYLDEAIKCK